MKKLFALIVLSALVFSLAACGGNTDSPESTTDNTEQSTASAPSNSLSSVKPGTWISSTDGVQTLFYFFNKDGKTGSNRSLETGTGLDFDYEIKENALTVKTDSEDSVVNGTVSASDDTIEITWSDGKKETLKFYSDKSGDEFEFYSNEDLALMALKYYADKNDGYTPSSYGTLTNDDGTVTIQLFDNLGDHNSTAAWYTVDRFTAAGTDDMSQEKVQFEMK